MPTTATAGTPTNPTTSSAEVVSGHAPSHNHPRSTTKETLEQRPPPRRHKTSILRWNKSRSAEQQDYIVEFECHHPSETTITDTIPPFRIISSTENPGDCDGGDTGRTGRFLWRRRRQPTSKTTTQHRRVLSRHQKCPNSSQSTLPTLMTTTSSWSSANAVDHDDENDDDDEHDAIDTPRSVGLMHDDSETGPRATARLMMDRSEQYYCLGQYYQYELCQPQSALQYYDHAHQTALQSYRNVAVSSPSSTRSLLLELQGQIQLTKECMGRIHFELGNIDEAMKMI